MGHNKFRFYFCSLLLWIVFLIGWYAVRRLTVIDGRVYYVPELLRECLENIDQQRCWWGDMSLESVLLPEQQSENTDQLQLETEHLTEPETEHRMQLQWQQSFLLDRDKEDSFRQGTIKSARDLNVFREEYGLYRNSEGDLVSCINEIWLVESAGQTDDDEPDKHTLESLVLGILSWDREVHRFRLSDKKPWDSEGQNSEEQYAEEQNAESFHCLSLTADLSIEEIGRLFPRKDELRIDWTWIITGYARDRVINSPADATSNQQIASQSGMQPEEEMISVWIQVDPVRKLITEIRVGREADQLVRKHDLVIHLFPETGIRSVPSTYINALSQEEN